MRVALIGGTGFVGSYLVDALLAAGHEPVLLVRRGSEHRVSQPGRCLLVAGDVGDAAAMSALLKGCDAAIYLVGILREAPAQGITFDALQFEGARQAIDLAAEHRVQRFLLMSANGIADSDTKYARTKLAAERYLQASGLDATVFRPSVIFGDPRGRMEFATQLLQQMIRPPIPAPAFFRGLWPGEPFRMSPVHVEDVARAFAAALDDGRTISGCYALGGSATLAWPDIIRTLAAAVGRRKLVLPAPAFAVHTACLLFDRYGWFPITRDQLRMLLDGNVVDAHEAFDMLEIRPRPFCTENLAYLDSD